jgi:hypothetical protein
LLRQCVVSVLVVGLSLAGCNKSDMLQKFASVEDQSLARKYIELLRERQLDEIEKSMDPSLAGPSMNPTLVKMTALFPPGEPTSITLVGAQSFYTSDSSKVNLTFEYGFAGQWLLTNVAFKKQHGTTTIVGFHVYPEPASLEAQNKFELRGKSPMQYAVLGLAIIIPLFTLWALLSCVRTKLKGRKWPWILFILLGVGKFAVNWTTGAWGFAPISVQLFGVSAIAPFYGAWTLAVSLPLGAIVFLLFRGKLRLSGTGN